MSALASTSVAKPEIAAPLWLRWPRLPEALVAALQVCAVMVSLGTHLAFNQLAPAYAALTLAAVGAAGSWWRPALGALVPAAALAAAVGG
ncbi:MAG: hypothetical protein LBH76_04840, partial [Propionibacteriaceae bacterium]|nr:hypothetical protein [Propionibacteriaceae bacterium]